MRTSAGDHAALCVVVRYVGRAWMRPALVARRMCKPGRGPRFRKRRQNIVGMIVNCRANARPKHFGRHTSLFNFEDNGRSSPKQWLACEHRRHNQFRAVCTLTPTDRRKAFAWFAVRAWQS